MVNGKAIIVTGSGRGIGRAIALTLARHGANIVVNDVNMVNAEEVVNEIRAIGTQAIAVQADVTSQAQVENMIQVCVDTFGKVDGLVNNAGIAQAVPLEEITEEAWDRMMAINLKGVFLCCKAVLPQMIQQKYGKIVNIASVAGKRGGGLMGNSCYAASKGGVIAFTKSLAREAAPHGINVNAITPGFTDTEMTSWLSPERKAAIVKLIPLGRPGQPTDIANAVCYLASEYSSYMTGEIMDVDGGLMMD